eukprot:XP_023156637.1 uncharacterized protein LOC103634819 [Zea mays]
MYLGAIDLGAEVGVVDRAPTSAPRSMAPRYMPRRSQVTPPSDLQNGFNKAIHVIKKSCDVRLQINGDLAEFSALLETSRCFFPLPKFFSSRSPSPPRLHPPLSALAHAASSSPSPLRRGGSRRPTPPSSASADASSSPTLPSSAASMSSTGRLTSSASSPTTTPALPLPPSGRRHAASWPNRSGISVRLLDLLHFQTTTTLVEKTIQRRMLKRHMRDVSTEIVAAQVQQTLRLL